MQVPQILDAIGENVMVRKFDGFTSKIAKLIRPLDISRLVCNYFVVVIVKLI